MPNKLHLFTHWIPSHFRNSKIVLLLLLVCIFNANASPNYTSQAYQSHQEATDQPSIQNWLYNQLGRAARLAKNYFNTNLPEGYKYSGSKNNSACHLQYMLDVNDLYNELKAFKEKSLFEVLAIVYILILLEIDALDQDIAQTELEPPAWIIAFRSIIQRIKADADLSLIERKKTKFEPLGEIETKVQLNARAMQCFSIIQILLQNQDETNKSISFRSKLNKQVSLLMSKAKNNTNFFTEVLLINPSKLLNTLLATYTELSTSITHSAPEFPVLEALAKWGMNNADSKISTLLDNSKHWSEQNHLTATEKSEKNDISKNDQILFTYLNYNSSFKLHDTEQFLHCSQVEEVTSALLDNYIIKNLTTELETVELLASACQDGFDSLEALHNNIKQQENLSPEQKARNTKEKQHGEFSQEDMDEYLQQGMTENIKNSFLGKMASNLCYAFNAVKNNFITTPAKQEKRKKVVADWIKLVQKNTLEYTDRTKEEGIRLVMRQLIMLDELHTENLTIADALTTLVEQHLSGKIQGDAFTILTGLKCTTNKHCYNLRTPHNDWTNQSVKNGYESQKYRLHATEVDSTLCEPDTEQQNCNDITSEQCNKNYLHQDWRFIEAEFEEEHEVLNKEKRAKNRGFTVTYNKASTPIVSKLIAIALPLFIIANTIPSSYAAPTPDTIRKPKIVISIYPQQEEYTLTIRDYLLIGGVAAAAASAMIASVWILYKKPYPCYDIMPNYTTPISKLAKRALRSEHSGRRRERSERRLERFVPTERSERSERSEHTERLERFERFERSGRSGRFEHFVRIERFERIERIERPERPERNAESDQLFVEPANASRPSVGNMVSMFEQKTKLAQPQPQPKPIRKSKKLPKY
ncbi:MAG: hypothetical protein QS721_11665 [Candidatus Endonucleobacter sp. (ex Gigantidas childressi)]|nr:hypothetical protein [Candidatus Endonucleobacter sp. (ex Gigantidas childressi)]